MADTGCPWVTIICCPQNQGRPRAEWVAWAPVTAGRYASAVGEPGYGTARWARGSLMPSQPVNQGARPPILFPRIDEGYVMMIAVRRDEVFNV